MRIVAVIPAKSKSRRVPEKNFKPFFGGKSLLEIKVSQCQKSGVFDSIYVSSDDQRACDIAQRLGAIFVPRAPALCLDSTPWHEVLTGILDSLPEPDETWIAWCPVTSPLFSRYEAVISALRDKLAEGINSIATVTPLKHYYLDERFFPINHLWGVWATYSQSLPILYQLNHACTVSQKREMKFANFQIGSRPDFFCTEHWEGLDIDTPEEFELAQWYFEKKLGSHHD
jgi:CMP-N-acetylneuraminic acid synthetase